MRAITCIFWVILVLFLYKLTFLEREEPRTDRKISIARDENGLPHIYGKNYEDILFGLGYAEAQDRMFTLYFKKMFAQGRASQIFGPDLIVSDLQMRNIGFHEMGKMNKNHTDAATLKLLQAYADGINAYARDVKLLPLQFYLFWVNWQDWTIENTLATINLMSFFLQFDWLYEIARQRLFQTVGFDLAIKIMSYGGNSLFRNTTIVSDDELKQQGKFSQYSFEHQRKVLLEHWGKNNISLGSVHLPEIELAVQGSGSNAWAIGKQHTVSGRPILANDPHLGSMIPNVFYSFEVVLLNQDNSTKSRKFGIMPDGLPTVSIGISEICAWGSTAAYIDNKDVYHETVRNNSGKMQYLFKDKWVDFRQRRELIKVRGAADIEEVFYHTHRGVVLQTIFMDLHWKYGYPMPKQYKDNHTLTLVANHFLPDNSSAAGLLKLFTFQSHEEYAEAGLLINHPNIDSLSIYPNGSIVYAGVGAIPSRKIQEMGSFIKDGNSDLYDMGEPLSYNERIYVFDSAKGYTSMGNNRFASDNYQFRSSLHQITTGRSYLIDKLIKDKIKNKEKFDFEDMKKFQLNQKDQFLSEVLPQFLGRLTHFKYIWSNPQTEALFSKLVGWDTTLGRDSVEAAIYQVWEHLFHYSLLSLTNLTEYERHAIVSHAFFQNYYFNLMASFGANKLTDEEKAVCQSLQTAKYKEIHPCQAAMALAFKKLPAEMQKLFGTDNVEEYQWGKIHEQTFKIVPFSQIPGLKYIWNRNYPAGGNSRTLNVAIHAHQAKDYNSIGSPAFRFITDLNRTLYSVQSGQTDRITSPNFDKFIDANTYLEYVHVNPFIEGLPKGWQFYVNKLQ